MPHLTEKNLQEEQRRLAGEIEKLLNLSKACSRQRAIWEETLEGQRQAGRNRPQDLGLWQAYAARQLEALRKLESDLAEQENKVNEQRQAVLRAHQECEKLKKLKERQKQAFLLAEQRREQQILDEAGQVIYQRKRALSN